VAQITHNRYIYNKKLISMVHPKYSPEEALQRIKLMMEYDSSKTYTENKVIVENKTLLNEIEPATVTILVGSALAALGIGGMWSEYSTEDSETKLRELTKGCDKNTAEAQKLKRETLDTQQQTKMAGLFRKSFDWTVGGFGIGGGTDLETLRGALSELEKNGNFGDFCKIREMMGKDKFEEEMIDELNTSEIGEVTNTIEVLLAKSVKGNLKIRDAETANEQWWLNQFPCLEVTDSFVNPLSVQNDRYGNTFVEVEFKVKGLLKKFHLLQNGRIYTADTHKYTGKKVQCSGTKVSVVGESIKKKSIFEQADLGDIDLSAQDGFDLGGGGGSTPTPSPDPSPRPSSSFQSCSGVYRKGCKSDVIAKVQGCLGGLAQDGKFGPKTEARLNEKHSELGGIFRDSEVDKICAGGSEQMDPSLKPEPGSIDEL
jgi:hypothetical protein